MLDDDKAGGDCLVAGLRRKKKMGFNAVNTEDAETEQEERDKS